jgi:hypothetical protein
MLKKPLIATNPYLQMPEKYWEALVTNVSSSTAIETGAPVESVARKLAEGNITKALKTGPGSDR